jgi:urease accessory protein
MIRALRIAPAGTWDGVAADTVVLDYDQRHRRHGALKGEQGTGFLLDLSDALPLRDGDGLVLEDGRAIAVSAAPEALAEIRASGASELMRIAWHLGTRRLPARLAADHILIRRDAAIETMVRSLGGTVKHRDAPFEPEAGPHNAATPHHHDADEHDDRL